MQEHVFPDFSLTTLKFPNFSRFSRWVATPCFSVRSRRLERKSVLSLFWIRSTFGGNV